MSKDQLFHYPAPLAVGFYKWGDQCAPMVQFSTFLSVKWDRNFNVALSEVWTDPNISSVLFAGSECGTIVIYKILSEKEKIIDVVPLSLVFAHQSKVVSIIEYQNIIYTKCVASLSEDGTLSIISLLDMTVVLHKPHLFTEHSRFLESHEANYRLVMAAQECGTIEVMDIIDATLVLRISGFSSIITSISHHGSIHGIACADGSISVLTINQNTAECIYSLKFEHHPGEEVNSIISPNLTFVLQITSKSWSLYDCNKPLITKEIDRHDDIFYGCKWITNEYFMIFTLSGIVEIWQVMGNKNDVQVLDRINSVESQFTVSGLNGNHHIKTVILNNIAEELTPIHQPPTLVFAMVRTYDGHPSRVDVTVDGFVVHSPGKSIIVLQNSTNKFNVSLSPYFSSKTRCRCAIGDPIRHSAKIGSDSTVYYDGNPVGEHHEAFMLYSPPINIDVFFTFSYDCSIRAWIPAVDSAKMKYKSFHDLCETVKKILWIEEKQWMIIIGQKSAFSVIDIKKMKSIMLCTGHTSPIVDVRLLNGMLHARCESNTIYSWNIDSQLVSRSTVKNVKRVGENNVLPAVPSIPIVSRSAPLSLHSALINQPLVPFSKIVSLIMPNCQTFAIILDIFSFLAAFKEFEELPIRTDPQFKTLILLWKNHIGKDKLNFDSLGPLDDFSYALAGDNFTVTLPIATKTSKIPSLRKISSESKFELTSLISVMPSSGTIMLDKVLKEKSIFTPTLAFQFSPLLTSIHSIASSVVGQCFINTKNDEGIAIISALSQTQTSAYTMNCVRPCFSALANWLDYPSDSLRIIIVNVIQDTMCLMSQEDQFELVKKVQQTFASWPITLPFAFLYNRKFALPTNFGQSAARKMFPVIFERFELLDLLISCFPNFSQYITNMGEFFTKLLEATSQRIFPINKLISFALEKPLDFFDIIQNNPQCPYFIDLLFERWLKPNREVLFDFLLKVMEAQPKNPSINYEHIISTICIRMAFIGACRNYIVFGNDDGTIVILSRESRKVIWELQISAHPISYITVSPSGHRFVILSIPDKILTWASAIIGNNKANIDPFELAGTTPITFNTVPTSSVWFGDVKLTLKNHNEKLLDISAPNLTFFQRLIPH